MYVSVRCSCNKGMRLTVAHSGTLQLQDGELGRGAGQGLSVVCSCLAGNAKAQPMDLGSPLDAIKVGQTLQVRKKPQAASHNLWRALKS